MTDHFNFETLNSTADEGSVRADFSMGQVYILDFENDS